MKKLTLKEHQKLIFNILKDFANFCECNNLNYFLDAGTLLGAIRHNGFIPWDNDADVCMPRPDFDKFVDLLKLNNNKINEYLVAEMPEDSLFPFLKVSDTRTKLVEYPKTLRYECYVYIDVFCKDGLPNNLRKAKKICKRSEHYVHLNWFYQYSMKTWNKSKNIFKKIIFVLFKPFIKTQNKWNKKQVKYLDKIKNKYPYAESKYVTTLTNGEFNRKCEKKIFDSYCVHKFEDSEFRIPLNYNEWLTILYGNNYMEIPSVEEQIVHEVEVYLNESN